MELDPDDPSMGSWNEMMLREHPEVFTKKPAPWTLGATVAVILYVGFFALLLAIAWL